MNCPKSCVALVTILLLCLPCYVESQAGSPSVRFPESRSYSPGRIWLEWSPSERTGFVRGFIVGHEEGYRQACTASVTNNRVTASTTGFDPCLEKRHLFKKDLSYYEQFVTDFYNRYTEDRDVPLRILLSQADERTPNEVHEWLAKKE